MNEKNNIEGLGSRNLSRRDFLRLMGLLTAVGVVPQALIGCTSASTPEATAGVTAGAALPTVATPGERVAEIVVNYQSSLTWYNELFRKVALDGEEVGLQYKLDAVATSAWLNAFYEHTYGNLLAHANDSRDYRDSDPTEQLVARVHSRESEAPRRNIGEYKNPEVDRLAEIIETELDQEKRLQAAYEIQDILAHDYYFWASCTGPNPIHAYNSEDFTDITVTPGACIAGSTYIWNWLSVRPTGDRTRAIYAVTNLDTLTVRNPFGPGGVRGIPNQLYFDKMLALSPELETIPWVVTDWTMVDDLTWELTMRDGIKWHDGNPATVEDLAFSFNYAVKWQPSFLAVVWNVVESAEVVDDHTVRLKTSVPAANMTTDLLIRMPLVAKHIWETVVEDQGVEDPSAVVVSDDMIVGTGAYMFDHFTPDVELLLKANKDHWMAPNLEELLLVLTPSLDSMLGRLESKEIDFEAEFLTPSQAERLEQQPHISVAETSRSLNPFIVCYMPELPFRDPVFRKAWHMTVDRKYLVDVVWEGAGTEHDYDTLMGPLHPFHNPNISERYEYDLEGARNLLAEGGYSWDADGRLLYPGPDNEDFKQRTVTGLAT